MPAPTSTAPYAGTRESPSVASIYARAHADPVDEARRWLDTARVGERLPALLLVIGLDEGHLLDVLDECPTPPKVVAIEPDPDAARRFLARRDWSRWLQSGRLLHLVAPQYAGAADAWRSFPASVDDCVMLVHPRLHQGPGTADAARVAQGIVAGARANADARRRFAPRYLTNSVRNVPAMLRGRDVRALTDAYRGTPAIVAAAGPSLDAAIPHLAGLHDRALLMAVDTALRPLLSSGITPQFVVGADPGAANARHFQWLPPCPDTWLIAESALDRSATEVFDGRTLWFRLARHQPWPWLNQHGFDVGQIDMWGSVLTAAFQVAVLAGCDPIVIVGADLAFTNGQPYARATTYEFDWAHGVAIGVTLDEWWRVQISRGQLRTAPDVRGDETTTTTAMISFRDWMLERAQRSGRRVVNASGDGILHGGSIVQASLADVFHDASARQIPAPAMVAGTVKDVGAAVRETVASALMAAKGSLAHGALSSPPIAEWKAFSGDGFDAAALAGALADAAVELAAHERPLASASAIDWPTIAAAPETRDLLCRLPEAMLQFHRLIQAPANPGGHAGSGEQAGPGGQTGPGGPALRGLLASGARMPDLAFELLAQVTAAALRVEDLEPSVGPEVMAQTAVSAAYRWPEHLRFAIEIVEAMIGSSADTWPPCAHAPFAGRAVSPRETSGTAVDAIEPARAHAATGVLRLASHWVRGASAIDTSESDRIAVERLMGILALSANPAHDIGGPGPTFSITTQGGGLHIPLRIPESALVRVLTGTIRESRAHAIHLGHVGAAVLQISAAPGSPPAGEGLAAALPATPGMPRVLTDEGAPDATVAYATTGGVVCVRPQRLNSVIVRAEGAVNVHLSWPRPILNELPWGHEGAVAWGDGLTDPVAPASGYVMYRRSREAPVEIAELPVRPTSGVWWRGRIYWSCFPRRIETWVGLASWAPGEDVKLEMPGFPPMLGMHADADDLLLRPGTPREGGGWRRVATPAGWHWTPGSAPRPAPSDLLGTVSSHAAGDRCLATAYPESDVIRLRRGDGRTFDMTCYYPMRLAWVAGTLVVSTGERELLFFENLADAVERQP